MEFQTMDYILLGAFVIMTAAMAFRGLYQSVMGLAVTILSGVGAYYLSRTLTETVTALAYPWVYQRAQDSLNLDALPTIALSSVDLSALTRQINLQLPESLKGLTDSLHLNLKDFLTDALQNSAATVRQGVMDAISEMLRTATETLVHTGLFVLSFLVLKLVLTLVKNAIGLTIDLPIVRSVDAIGGAILGFVECAIIFYGLFWIASAFQFTPLLDLFQSSAILSTIFRFDR